MSRPRTVRSEYRKEYKTWLRMLSRCYDENDTRYPWYGGRGIAVCAEWRDSFEQFLADMGPAPTPDHTIDRYPENDGDYHPQNCRWATMLEQGQNRRTTVNLEHEGQVLSIAEWARRRGMDRRVLHKRLAAGWPVALAIDTPLAGPQSGRKAA